MFNLGGVSYTIPFNMRITQLNSTFASSTNILTFFNNHPEIHCGPLIGYPCIAAGAVLSLKWEELSAAPVGWEAQREADRMIWMVVRVDESNLSLIKGPANLAQFRTKWVLLRGAWQGGVFVPNPANMFFVFNESTGSYALPGPSSNTASGSGNTSDRSGPESTSAEPPGSGPTDPGGA
jgi:hypothetical protein